MGQGAEMILSGLVCQVCGDVIDEDEPGHPRTCENCGGGDGEGAVLIETDWQEFEKALSAAGYIVTASKSISNGMQYTLKGGEIICKYNTGRFSLGGKKNKALRNLMFKLLNYC